MKAACVWALGQIGRHTADHARALAQADVFSSLIAVYKDEKSSSDLKLKAKNALKAVLEKCTHLPALEPLLKVILFVLCSVLCLVTFRCVSLSGCT